MCLLWGIWSNLLLFSTVVLVLIDNFLEQGDCEQPVFVVFKYQSAKKIYTFLFSLRTNQGNKAQLNVVPPARISLRYTTMPLRTTLCSFLQVFFFFCGRKARMADQAFQALGLGNERPGDFLPRRSGHNHVADTLVGGVPVPVGSPAMEVYIHGHNGQNWHVYTKAGQEQIYTLAPQDSVVFCKVHPLHIPSKCKVTHLELDRDKVIFTRFFFFWGGGRPPKIQMCHLMIWTTRSVQSYVWSFQGCLAFFWWGYATALWKQWHGDAKTLHRP